MSDEAKLSLEAKAAIRGYMVSLLALPGILGGLVLFFAGFFLNGVAKDHIENENTRTLQEVLAPARATADAIEDLAKDASSATADIQKAKVVVDGVVSAPLAGLIVALHKDATFLQSIKSLNVTALEQLNARASELKELRIRYVTTQGQTPAGSTSGVSAVATCPADLPVPIAGGFKYGTRNLRIFYSHPTGYGWLVRAGNEDDTTPSVVFTAFAVCANIDLG